MRIFRCATCSQLVYFENTSCVQCGSTLAYLPEERRIVTLAGSGGLATGGRIFLCRNYRDQGICNWGSAEPAEFCRSCALTTVVPNVRDPGNFAGWARLESAKRRMLHNLFSLGLPVAPKSHDLQRGLEFRFLAAERGGSVVTGHEQGCITVDVAEADDAERERRRIAMGEPYRTLLGHFRHEIGHYYWDVLIDGAKRLDEFRQTFGDEREDYAEALRHHYEHGAPEGWQENFLSAYATTHPWEDWAETWAHYMHMTDTLETAQDCGLAVADAPGNPAQPSPPAGAEDRFDLMISSWFRLTHVLNNLNRGMGHPDAYPFVLPAPAIRKLEFVHDTIRIARTDAEGEAISGCYETNVSDSGLGAASRRLLFLSK